MDDVDRANETAQAELDRLIARARPQREGRPDCQDCGDPVSPLRQGLGAVRCLDCQEYAEALARGCG